MSCPFTFTDGTHHPVLGKCPECGYTSVEDDEPDYAPDLMLIFETMLPERGDEKPQKHVLIHEIRDLPAFGGLVHRLVVDGDRGPYVSKHAITVNGRFRATTEVFRHVLPRVFVAVDMSRFAEDT